MITEDFCSFEVAKLLKEKGFNEPLRCWYDNFQDFHEEGVRMSNSDCLPPTIMCPTWLREVHNLFIEPYVVKNYSKKKLEYTYSIQDLDFQGSDDGIECCKNWDTPEQACETAIKYCLENLI